MRRRERPAVPVGPLGLPAELAMGPQIERWAGPEPDSGNGWDAASSAFSRWQKALREWASRAGVDYKVARAEARTGYPWSRRYLLEAGRADVVRRYEGRE